MSARSGIQVCSELNSGSINTVYVYSSVLWIKYKYTISTLHFAVAAYFAIHKKNAERISLFVRIDLHEAAQCESVFVLGGLYTAV